MNKHLEILARLAAQAEQSGDHALAAGIRAQADDLARAIRLGVVGAPGNVDQHAAFIAHQRGHVTARQHAEALQQAEAAGYARAQAAVDVRRLRAEAHQVRAERLQQLARAGLDPQFEITEGVTLASVAEGFPATEEGQRMFECRAAEWFALAAKGREERRQSGPIVPPFGGGDSRPDTPRSPQSFM